MLVLGSRQAHAQAPAAAPFPESFRIRVVNDVQGTISVSNDGGTTWRKVATVLRPATAAATSTSPFGVVEPSSVAGVTPDSIVVRLPAPAGQFRLLRVTASTQNVSGAVVTDLSPRSALFRYIAPSVGSAVRLERDGAAISLPVDYLPRPGDSLLILVPRLVEEELTAVTVENKADGDVLLARPGGPLLLAKVRQPLKGIGRYGGTERAGAGALLAWSPTLVMVGTAGPKTRVNATGEPAEERGGFIVQPSEPALRGATHPASQILLDSVPVNGVKPLVSRFFGLPASVSTGDPLEPKATRVDVRIDGGEWEPMPDLRGPIQEAQFLEALRQALGPQRKVEQGITHFRFSFAAPGEAAVQRRILLASSPSTGKPVKGRVNIQANVMGEGISYVQFVLDGDIVRYTNLPPFDWEWDTTKAANGDHLLEIRGLDQNLSVVSSVFRRVTVEN